MQFPNCARGTIVVFQRLNIQFRPGRKWVRLDKGLTYVHAVHSPIVLGSSGEQNADLRSRWCW
jgi:hypothetical protein